MFLSNAFSFIEPEPLSGGGVIAYHNYTCTLCLLDVPEIMQVV